MVTARVLNGGRRQFLSRYCASDMLHYQEHFGHPAATAADAPSRRTPDSCGSARRHTSGVCAQTLAPLQWTDAFQPDRGDGRTDVAFEKAALLFNLGAIESQVHCRGRQMDLSCCLLLKLVCYNLVCSSKTAPLHALGACAGGCIGSMAAKSACQCAQYSHSGAGHVT